MILIVDDDLVYADALQEVLRPEVPAAEIHIFTYGSAAIDWVERNGPPEVVVLDMMVPLEADDLEGGRPPTRKGQLPRGVQILERLCDAGAHRDRIIVITALIQRELAAKLQEMSIPESHILFKPARTQQISQLVRTIHALRG